MAVYLGLFFAALIAATLLPMQSEAVLVVLLLQGERPVAALLLVATCGNVMGAVINWYLGRFLLRYRERAWFPASARQMERATGWFRTYGRWTLLGSWIPIVGDPLTVAAGVLREPLLPFVLIVTLGKAARYLFVAAATLAWVPGI